MSLLSTWAANGPRATSTLLASNRSVSSSTNGRSDLCLDVWTVVTHTHCYSVTECLLNNAANKVCALHFLTHHFDDINYIYDFHSLHDTITFHYQKATFSHKSPFLQIIVFFLRKCLKIFSHAFCCSWQWVQWLLKYLQCSYSICSVPYNCWNMQLSKKFLTTTLYWRSFFYCFANNKLRFIWCQLSKSHFLDKHMIWTIISMMQIRINVTWW